MKCIIDKIKGAIGQDWLIVPFEFYMPKYNDMIWIMTKSILYYSLNTSIVEEVMVWLSGLRGDDDEKN